MPALVRRLKLPKDSDSPTRTPLAEAKCSVEECKVGSALCVTATCRTIEFERRKSH